jgi:hypothetical protein
MGALVRTPVRGTCCDGCWSVRRRDPASRINRELRHAMSNGEVMLAWLGRPACRARGGDQRSDGVERDNLRLVYGACLARIGNFVGGSVT